MAASRGIGGSSAELCGDFKRGLCDRGERCKFVHSGTSTPSSSNRMAEACGDFKRGMCDRGDRCRFSHGDTASRSSRTTDGNRDLRREPTIRQHGFKVLVPESVVGLLLGGSPAGGTKLKDEIQNVCNAKLTLSDRDEHFPHTRLRAIIVHADDLPAVFAAVVRLVDASIEQADKDRDADRRREAEPRPGPGEIIFRVLLPGFMTEGLIGPGGAHLGQLQHETGARAIPDRECFDDNLLMHLVGVPPCVRHALDMVIKAVDRASGREPFLTWIQGKHFPANCRGKLDQFAASVFGDRGRAVDVHMPPPLGFGDRGMPADVHMPPPPGFGDRGRPIDARMPPPPASGDRGMPVDVHMPPPPAYGDRARFVDIRMPPPPSVPPPGTDPRSGRDDRGNVVDDRTHESFTAAPPPRQVFGRPVLKPVPPPSAMPEPRVPPDHRITLEAINFICDEIPTGGLTVEYSINCDLPEEKCMILVGRRNEYLEFVEKVTRTQVQFENMKAEGMRRMTIVGHLLSVYMAHMLMMKRYLQDEQGGPLEDDPRFRAQLDHVLAGGASVSVGVTPKGSPSVPTRFHEDPPVEQMKARDDAPTQRRPSPQPRKDEPTRSENERDEQRYDADALRNQRKQATDASATRKRSKSRSRRRGSGGGARGRSRSGKRAGGRSRSGKRGQNRSGKLGARSKSRSRSRRASETTSARHGAGDKRKISHADTSSKNGKPGAVEKGSVDAKKPLFQPQHRKADVADPVTTELPPPSDRASEFANAVAGASLVETVSAGKKRAIWEDEEDVAVQVWSPHGRPLVTVADWDAAVRKGCLDSAIRNVFDVLGLQAPTAFQRYIVPAIAERQQDVVIEAADGLGQTLGYVLPLLSRLIVNPPPSRPHYMSTAGCKAASPVVLVLSAYPESAKQTGAEFRDVAECAQLDVQVLTLCDGEPLAVQMRQIDQSQYDVVCATPGRVLEVLNTDRLSLAHVHTIVLDEADSLLVSGDQVAVPEVSEIIRSLPGGRQTLIMSGRPLPVRLADSVKSWLRLPQHIAALQFRLQGRRAADEEVPQQGTEEYGDEGWREPTEEEYVGQPESEEFKGPQEGHEQHGEAKQNNTSPEEFWRESYADAARIASELTGDGPEQTLIWVDNDEVRWERLGHDLLRLLWECRSDQRRITVYSNMLPMAAAHVQILSQPPFGLRCCHVHGQMPPKEREDVCLAFVGGNFDILFATVDSDFSSGDVAVDFTYVGAVVHVETPPTIEEYDSRTNVVQKAMSYIGDADQHLAPGLVGLLEMNEREVPQWLRNFGAAASAGGGF